MDQAIKWIQELSVTNYSAMDSYRLGGVVDLNFAPKDEINVDLLSHFIKDNALLRSVAFQHTIIPKPDFLLLLDSLARNEFIQSFQYRQLDFNVVFDSEAVAAFASMIRRCKSLQEFNLSCATSEISGLAAICEAVAAKGTLLHLRLSGLLASDSGLPESEAAHILGRLIARNTSLVHLAVHRLVSLTDDGLRALAAGLDCNTSLQVLNLSTCGINDSGACLIAESLSRNKQSKLRELNLCFNKIKVSGKLAFANMLRSNQILETLRLQQGLFEGDEVAEVLNVFLDVLSHSNVSLKSLSLSRDNEFAASVLHRNSILIPEAVRRASLYLIGIRQSTLASDGMGDLAVFPKDIVKLLAQHVWATRKDPKWIDAV